MMPPSFDKLEENVRVTTAALTVAAEQARKTSESLYEVAAYLLKVGQPAEAFAKVGDVYAECSKNLISAAAAGDRLAKVFGDRP